jgi:hypothetical protein
MRPWLVKDPRWTPAYVAEPDENTPTRMSLDALKNLLRAVALGGGSAFAGIFGDVDSRKR